MGTILTVIAEIMFGIGYLLVAIYCSKGESLTFKSFIALITILVISLIGFDLGVFPARYWNFIYAPFILCILLALWVGQTGNREVVDDYYNENIRPIVRITRKIVKFMTPLLFPASIVVSVLMIMGKIQPYGGLIVLVLLVLLIGGFAHGCNGWSSKIWKLIFPEHNENEMTFSVHACYLATFLIGTIISCNYLGIKAGIIAGIIEFAYLIGAITIGDDVDNTGYALGKKDAFLHIVSLVFACMIAFKYLHFLAYIG